MSSFVWEAWYVGAGWRWTATTLQSYSGVTLKSPISENRPNGHSFQWSICLSTLCGNRIFISLWTMENDLVKWPEVWNEEDKEVCIWRGWYMKTFISQVNIHHTVFNTEEALNHHEDRMTRPVDVCHLTHHCWHNGCINGDTIAVGLEIHMTSTSSCCSEMFDLSTTENNSEYDIILQCHKAATCWQVSSTTQFTWVEQPIFQDGIVFEPAQPSEGLGNLIHE
jgi:hypothetical protein